LGEPLNLLEMYSRQPRPEYVSRNGDKTIANIGPCEAAEPTESPSPDSIEFIGNSWISYNFCELPEYLLDPNSREELHLSFKTAEPNGPIYFSSSHDLDFVIKLEVCILSSFK